MFLGYQNGKVKFYTELPLEKNVYNIDKIEETDLEYVLDDEQYVLKNDFWLKKQHKKETERIAKLKLSKREVFLEIYKDKGITPDDIKAKITNPEALIELEYANEYYRGNPLVDIIGASLGYSKEDLDYFFENKTFITNGGEENA